MEGLSSFLIRGIGPPFCYSRCRLQVWCLVSGPAPLATCEPLGGRVLSLCHLWDSGSFRVDYLRDLLQSSLLQESSQAPYSQLCSCVLFKMRLDPLRNPALTAAWCRAGVQWTLKSWPPPLASDPCSGAAPHPGMKVDSGFAESQPGLEGHPF